MCKYITYRHYNRQQMEIGIVLAISKFMGRQIMGRYVLGVSETVVSPAPKPEHEFILVLKPLVTWGSPFSRHPPI